MVKQKEDKSDPQLDAWGVAKKYAELYGNFPSSFSTVIRALTKEGTAEETLRNAHWQLHRLLRSVSMLSPFYFAAKTYYGGRIAKLPQLNAKTLVGLFRHEDLSAVFGLLYLYRRARKLSDEKEFTLLAGDLQQRCDAAGFVGLAIPNIGLGLGILSASMRLLGMTAFMLHDQKGFAEYRRRLKMSARVADIPFEITRWGCSHAQIASTLLIEAGFSREIAEKVCRGFEIEDLKSEPSTGPGYPVRCAELWTAALLKRAAPPDIVHSGSFYPLEDELKNLIFETSRVRERGSLYGWLDKKTEDCTAETAPELFASAPAAVRPAQPEPAEQQQHEDDLVKELDKELE